MTYPLHGNVGATYQSANGLPVTGEPSAELLRRLGG